MNNLGVQGRVFGRHFLGRTPNEQVLMFYKDAFKKSTAQPDKFNRRLLNFALANTWSIGLLDSGLALLQPEAEFRHRLYVMFAILEANQEYHEQFLPKQANLLYPLYILYVGLRSICKAAIGIVLVKVLT